ncbi:MAG: anti-sigma regulatory factor [Limnoraphis robusta]|jgi:serine/threonine-protein kinase RsbW|uniref:Anti-sigma regulatory factor n=2 Tax=Limnoraphis robusta TaxID=1118279 RepID=A0A0F5YDW5_9CYAN|nr:anti-sigma regulatory factor [Limnoraphis robusta]MCG5060186.1 anti-sigma regulatory factor [Limnoraphis sp. WC205]KKD36445.1 anti-sigma regulatory factor [Limnoraphis robusta CS-951]MEA5501171.1 anti-sigma regulatory factor [Limnoraphis robusta BA-68 BA1]MEA5522033.1 anti-sigma regulatory factor [Limnoraphis robusta CCNP1315]MEA5540599.1 anti-sigma regulatory factor [Limnoraphis robusta Tam1]
MGDDTLVVRSHLQVQTDLNALNEILQWFEKQTSTVLSEDLSYQCKIALTEGFTNVVRHAHRTLLSTTPIDLEVTIFPHYIEMRIWDLGQPFDLEQTLQYVRHLHTDPLAHEGSRGLLFMQKLTDELFYTRTEDERNCLLMRKRISKSF